MLVKQGKIDTLTTLVDNGALGEALTFAVSNKLPMAWVERCHALLMEKNAPIYAAAAVPIPESDDIVTQRRNQILREMEQAKADRRKMNKKDARQAASSFIRLGQFDKAKELEARFGTDVITKNYRKGTSKYMLWCKRQRLGIIGEYRHLALVDLERARKFRRKHEIQESEINPTFDKR